MQDGDPRKALLGRGWRFPLGVNGRRGIALSSYEQDIYESIYIILMTAKGERRMRPEFGCGIHDLAFAPDNTTTFGLIKEQVAEAISWWEPRVEVESVEVRPDAKREACLLVDVQYRIKATNDPRSLVYPFYRIPGEG